MTNIQTYNGWDAQGERFLESLREEGEKLEAEERVNNKKALANVLSDSLSALLLGVAVFTNKRRVQLLQVQQYHLCRRILCKTQCP